MPSVLPPSSAPRSCVGAQPDQAPPRTIRSPSRRRRVSARISARVRSAVASVSTSGVLGTQMPRAEQSRPMLTIRSPAFSQGGVIPPVHTCEGKDLSPALEFSGAPQGTKSLALIVHDPDAPDPKAPRIDWVHWLLYNLPPDCKGLAQGVAETALPTGTLSGVTAFKRTAWDGPR